MVSMACCHHNCIFFFAIALNELLVEVLDKESYVLIHLCKLV